MGEKSSVSSAKPTERAEPGTRLRSLRESEPDLVDRRVKRVREQEGDRKDGVERGRLDEESRDGEILSCVL